MASPEPGHLNQLIFAFNLTLTLIPTTSPLQDPLTMNHGLTQLLTPGYQHNSLPLSGTESNPSQTLSQGMTTPEISNLDYSPLSSPMKKQLSSWDPLGLEKQPWLSDTFQSQPYGLLTSTLSENMTRRFIDPSYSTTCPSTTYQQQPKSQSPNKKMKDNFMSDTEQQQYLPEFLRL